MMAIFTADSVNAAFDMTAPELKSKYARYPMKFPRWLSYDEKDPEGKPTFIEAKQDEGIKMDYVYCKRAPVKGYYHLLTKPSIVNLYSRLMSEGSGAGCMCLGDREKADAWDTTRLVLYARTRCSRPDDDDAKEQGIYHMEGTKLNPVHGINVSIST